MKDVKEGSNRRKEGRKARKKGHQHFARGIRLVVHHRRVFREAFQHTDDLPKSRPVLRDRVPALFHQLCKRLWTRLGNSWPQARNPNFFAFYARLRLEMGKLGWLVINFRWQEPEPEAGRLLRASKGAEMGSKGPFWPKCKKLKKTGRILKNGP